MKRAFVFLSGLVALGGAVYLAGQIQAQPTGTAPAAAPPKAGGKVAVFNVAKVMRDYKKWQYYAMVMNTKRTTATAELGRLRAEITDLQARIAKEPITQKQEEMAKIAVGKARESEDKERQIRKMLDDESANYLKNLFSEVQQAVKAIVDTNGFDVVFAYPDAITAEEMASPLYYDLKMRPPAAMPFYVSPSSDMTEVLILTLNKNFPPPADAVLPAGGVAPGVPAPPMPMK